MIIFKYPQHFTFFISYNISLILGKFLFILEATLLIATQKRINILSINAEFQKVISSENTFS